MNNSASGRPLFLLILGWAIYVVLAGCSPKIKSIALGKWRVEGGNQVMEFRNDGTCQGSDSYGRVVSGKFAFVDAEHVKIELTTTSEDKTKGVRLVDQGAGVAKIAVHGDDLSMTEEDGQAMHYKRLK